MDYNKLIISIGKACTHAKDSTPFQDALAVLTEYIEIDPESERERGRELREIGENKAIQLAEDGLTDEAEDVMEIVKEILRLNAPIDFDSYLLFMEWDREPEKCFYRPRRDVFYPNIVKHMQDLADDKLDFLSISCPPRVGKSTIGIFFLTWIMGKHPERANVMSGHSDSLTKGFHFEALQIIQDSSTYKFAQVFPNAELVDKSLADETISLKSKRRFPTLTCRSIGGTLTGAVEIGQNALLYLDDLVEDREQALNADRMDKLYAAYLNQLKDRMKDGAKQLCVATRWVPNDPIGRIEEEYGDDPRYRFIRIPALDERGRSNFYFPYNLGFSTKYYEDMHRSLTSAGEDDSWSAKYMCEPYWQQGLMFPEDELQYFDELPEEEPDAVIAVCDTKDRGSDYAVQPIGYVYGDLHYIVDVVCDNNLPNVFQPRLARHLIDHNVSLARYESNAAGGRVAEDVEKMCADQGHVIKIEKKFSSENKETRILVDSGWIKERCLFWREPPTQDYKRFMQMLFKYTISGKVKHDDAPDSMSMYKRFATSLVKATVKAFKRPW